MTIEHLIAFNLALLAAIASPRPALLMAVRTALSAGRRAGIAMGCGLGLMAAAWTLMALLGLEAIFRLFPWAYGGPATICVATLNANPEAGFVSLFSLLTYEPIGIALPAGDAQFINWTQNFLSRLEGTDTLKGLAKQWLGEIRAKR